MQKIIPIILALMFVGFATSAMADQARSSRSQDGYATRGQRIEKRLDVKGDRIQQTFHKKAVRAADHGRYPQARHFEQKGRQINRHLDRKGARIHQRFDHRYDYRHEYRPHHPYRPATHHMPRRDRHFGQVSLVIQQPGFLFAWGKYN
jgi:hypothetical protein